MAYRSCLGTHLELDCILRFETLGMAEEKTFFHCDQVSSSGCNAMMPTTAQLGPACLPACLLNECCFFAYEISCFEACIPGYAIEDLSSWCPHGSTFHVHMPTRPLCPQLLRGMYATYLKIWFQFFPRDSFLILNSVDFFEDNRATAKKV